MKGDRWALNGEMVSRAECAANGQKGEPGAAASGRTSNSCPNWMVLLWVNVTARQCCAGRKWACVRCLRGENWLEECGRKDPRRPMARKDRRAHAYVTWSRVECGSRALCMISKWWGVMGGACVGQCGLRRFIPLRSNLKPAAYSFRLKWEMSRRSWDLQ